MEIKREPNTEIISRTNQCKKLLILRRLCTGACGGGALGAHGRGQSRGAWRTCAAAGAARQEGVVAGAGAEA